MSFPRKTLLLSRLKNEQTPFTKLFNQKTMAYKIIDIEGVGDVYAEKLTAVGIIKVEDLLEKSDVCA